MDNRTDIVDSHLDQLALFKPVDLPVISLYLNLQPDQRGRDHFEPFVRKELRARAKTFAPRSIQRDSFERDVERINYYLQNEIAPGSNGAAIFACFGNEEFFDPLQLAAPVERNSIHVGRQPHLYPLAKISGRFRRYACLIADTNFARIYVFGTGERIDQEDIASPKTSRVQVGGWSQARYQRHVDNFRFQHVKEVVESLTKIVKSESVEKVFIAGDEVVLPKIREQLTSELKTLVADEFKFGIVTPERTILEATLEAARRQEGTGEEAKVKQLLDQYRAGALGVVGARSTLLALNAGQVNELVISADSNAVVNDIDPEEAELIASETPVTDPVDTDLPNIKAAEALILRARQTGADIAFIENTDLLSEVGGAGALLRYRI